MAEDGHVSSKMKRKTYEKELRKLQVQLCHLQEWVRENKLRVIVVFEGRDAARLNCMAHLKSIPFKRVSRDRVRLPKRSDSDKGGYNDQATLRGMKFVAERY
jgi:polyphosphate kinase 2 (PPK2 family)